MKRKLALVLLATMLSVSMLTSAYASELTDLNSHKNQLEQDQKDSEGKINDLQSKLDVVKGQIAQLEKKLETINAAISKTAGEVSDAQNKIAATDKSITATLKEIATAEGDLAKKKEILAKNVRLMYSKGDTSYMEYLFSSKDISDFLYRFDALKDIAKANRNLYDSVRLILNTLADKKASLDKRRTNQVTQKNELLTLQKTQENQKMEQLKTKADLDEMKASIEDNIADEQAAMDLIQSQAKEMARKIAAERKRLADEAKKNQLPAPSVPRGTGSYTLPVPVGSYYISSPYGWRTHPITGVRTFHNGYDFAAPYGTSIFAVDDGTVLYAGPASGFGNWIVIDHGNGLYSVYGHMYSDELYVNPGETVKRGQKIGAVGSAGSSTGYHLHFGMCDPQFNYLDSGALLGI